MAMTKPKSRTTKQSKDTGEWLLWLSRTDEDVRGKIADGMLTLFDNDFSYTNLQKVAAFLMSEIVRGTIPPSVSKELHAWLDCLTHLTVRARGDEVGGASMTFVQQVLQQNNYELEQTARYITDNPEVDPLTLVQDTRVVLEETA
jgi:hypothetical protein